MRMLRSSWTDWMTQCNLSCKIVKNFRIIVLNRAKKKKFCPRSVWLKKKKKKGTSWSCLLQTWCMKSISTRLVCTPPDLSPRFTCIKSKLVESRLISYFGLPFKQRNATCKFLATTEAIMCWIILYFGVVQLSIISPTEWLERLWINLIK